jgi:hypothetical protein
MQMAGIRRRTFAVEEFEHQRGNFDGHADDPDIAGALQIFEDAAASLDCQTLRSGRGSGQSSARLAVCSPQHPDSTGNTVSK